MAKKVVVVGAAATDGFSREQLRFMKEHCNRGEIVLPEKGPKELLKIAMEQVDMTNAPSINYDDLRKQIIKDNEDLRTDIS